MFYWVESLLFKSYELIFFFTIISFKYRTSLSWKINGTEQNKVKEGQNKGNMTNKSNGCDGTHWCSCELCLLKRLHKTFSGNPKACNYARWYALNDEYAIHTMKIQWKYTVNTRPLTHTLWVCHSKVGSDFKEAGHEGPKVCICVFKSSFP